MTLKEKALDQSICHCAGRRKFKTMNNCDHIITTDPELIADDFPIIYQLCKKGAKFRMQTAKVTELDVYKAIDQFRNNMERKYRALDSELLSFAQLLKALISPLLKDLVKDTILNISQELSRLHQMYVVTQVDKDASGIAFVCKTIAHKLTKRFIYGPCHNVPGLFVLDSRPLDTVVSTLQEYAIRRRRISYSQTLPKFKIIMKMHKKS